LRILTDLHPRLRENILERHAALPQRPGEILAKNAERPRFFGRDRARRRIESEKLSLLRIDQRKARGKRRLQGVIVRTGAIDDDDMRTACDGGQSVSEIGDLYRLDRNIDVTRDLSIDRYEIIVAGILKRAARQINEIDAVGACCVRLVKEVSQGLPKRLLIEVARTDHIEARRL